jgi:hypothetical protein
LRSCRGSSACCCKILIINRQLRTSHPEQSAIRRQAVGYVAQVAPSRRFAG